MIFICYMLLTVDRLLLTVYYRITSHCSSFIIINKSVKNKYNENCI